MRYRFYIAVRKKGRWQIAPRPHLTEEEARLAYQKIEVRGSVCAKAIIRQCAENPHSMIYLEIDGSHGKWSTKTPANKPKTKVDLV